MGLWLGTKEERLSWKRSRALCDSSMTRISTGTANVIIFGFMGAQCLHCIRQKAHGLPDKNVALLIRKEQRIMRNDDLMDMFVLIVQPTFLYCVWSANLMSGDCHLQMVLLVTF